MIESLSGATDVPGVLSIKIIVKPPRVRNFSGVPVSNKVKREVLL